MIDSEESIAAAEKIAAFPILFDTSARAKLLKVVHGESACVMLVTLLDLSHGTTTDVSFFRDAHVKLHKPILSSALAFSLRQCVLLDKICHF